MIESCTLMGWRPYETPTRAAAELAGGPFDARRLVAALPRAVPLLGDAKFLIVRVEKLALTEVRRAIQAFESAGGNARICLAGNRATFEHLAEVAVDHVGLMLDDVDLHTPPSEMIWHGYEAVRFSERFAAEARKDMRVACALASTHALARDLGLTTLGPIVPDPELAFEQLVFDYVPVDLPSQQLSSTFLRATPKPAFVNSRARAAAPATRRSFPHGS